MEQVFFCLYTFIILYIGIKTPHIEPNLTQKTLWPPLLYVNLQKTSCRFAKHHESTLKDLHI